MDNIKLVRLQNGEDIIGFVTDKDNGSYDVVEPMTVDLDYRTRQPGLIMKHLLPLQLVKKNEIVLENKDILFMVDPADSFAEYYVDTVEKIREILTARSLVDSMTDEEVDDAMDALDEYYKDGNTLH
jgi:protein-arginine kinase